MNVDDEKCWKRCHVRGLPKMMSKRVIIISLFVLLILVIPVNAAKITIYPTVDAVVWRNISAYPWDNWSTMTAGAGTEVPLDGVPFSLVGFSAANNNTANESTYVSNNRYVASFDFTTNTIPADATITSVVYGNRGTLVGRLHPDWGIVNGTLTNTTSAPVMDDYQKMGNTELAPRISYANWNNTSWNNYTFSAPGLNYATQSKGGYLVLFFTTSWDIDRTEGVSINWSSGRVNLNQVEKNETMYDPFLEVTYSQPVPLPAPTVTGITPSTGQNTTIISITNLAGTNFVSGATVNLTMSGQANITSGAVTVVGPTNITTTFDLTGAKVGAWNVNVTNPDGQEGSLVNGFSVTNITPAPTVTGITPNSGQNTTIISITNLAGTNFVSGATVNLTMSGQSNITSGAVTVVDPTNITTTFDLTGKKVGLWNVTVTNPDGMEGSLVNGFSVTNITPPAPDKVGVFRGLGYWYLDMNNNGTWDPTSDKAFYWGKQPGDTPITGDWNGDNITETGIFRSGGTWFLDMNNNGTWDASPPDTQFSWGKQPGDTPITGDWNNDNITETGIFRAGGHWYLDMNNNGTWDPTSDKEFFWGKQPGDIPVTGDWTGDGITKTGIFRPGTGFYLDINNNGIWDNTPTDTMLAWSGFGLQPNDIPVTGDPNGGGITATGIFRNGDWYLDINNNGIWDSGTDVIYPIGQPGDKPVTGKWS